jgi:hypothetical protein
MHQMQIDLPAPRSGQFLELSFRKLLKNCYDIADGSTPVRKKELVAWRTSPLFHHVGFIDLRAAQNRLYGGWSSAKGSHMLCPMAVDRALQYVETLSEQLDGLRQSPADRCKC